jgi:hypothetical protein
MTSLIGIFEVFSLKKPEGASVALILFSSLVHNFRFGRFAADSDNNLPLPLA